MAQTLVQGEPNEKHGHCRRVERIPEQHSPEGPDENNYPILWNAFSLVFFILFVGHVIAVFLYIYIFRDGDVDDEQEDV